MMNKINDVVSRMFSYRKRIDEITDIFNMNRNQIVSDFFIQIFDADVINNFESVRNKFADTFSYTNNNYPTDKEGFFKYIFNDIIQLHRTPSEMLCILKKKVLEIIEQIDELLDENEEILRGFKEKHHAEVDGVRLFNNTIENKKKSF